MNSKTQHLLHRTDRTIGNILHWNVCVMLFLAALIGIKALCVYWGIRFESYSAYPTILFAYKYAWYISGIIACTCVICRVILSPFVKSEEEEDFERKVNFILQQHSPKPQATSVPSDFSPLCDLSPEQEEQIITLLRDLPPNSNKPEAINLALVAQYLTALEMEGKIKLNDKHALRMWVERITGKNVPSSSQFNEAIPSKAKSKISAAQAEIKHLLQ